MYILVKSIINKKSLGVINQLEKHLIRKLKLHNSKALEKIMKEYTPYVYTIVYNMVGGCCSSEDIEELVSDVFIRLWNNAENLKEDCCLSPYIATISRNVCKNRLRELSTKPEIFELEDYIPSDDDVISKMENTLCLEYVEDFLKTLSKQDEEVFVRYYYYGENLTDIAKHLKISNPNVKVKIYRIRKKLKDFLTERGFTYEK